MSLDLDARQRAALDSLLRERGLYDRARAVLASTAASSTTGGDVFEALRSAGLTEELAEAAKDVNLDLDAATFSLLRREPPVLPAEAPASPQAQAQSQPPSQAQLPPAARAAAPAAGRSLLRITLGRGRAFLAHLDEANVEGDGGAGGDGLPGPSPSSFYVVHLLCCGQRFRSAAVPAAVEPDFGGASFDIDVTPEADADDGRVRSSGSSAATLRLLLDLPAPDHLEPVFDDAALIARARNHRPPARLRPGHDGDLAGVEIRHQMAVAAQALGVGDHQRRPVRTHRAPFDRRQGGEVDFGEVREHGTPPRKPTQEHEYGPAGKRGASCVSG